MKIKIIDLLIAIAGAGIGAIPQRIYYNGNFYEYDRETQNYYKSLNFTKDWLIGEDITALLNDEVEIIEEQKKIKKLDLDGYYDDNSYCECKSEWCSSEDVLVVKINEIIDEINKLKEKD